MPAGINPLAFLGAAGACQVLSILFLVSANSIFLPIIFSSAAIACLIAAVISVKADRDSAIKNQQSAIEATSATSKSNALYTGLQHHFDGLVEGRRVELQTEFDRRRHELEALTSTLQKRAENDFAARRAEMAAESERLQGRGKALGERESEIDEIVQRLGKRFLNDSVKFISQKLNANNFTVQRERLVKVIEFCRRHRFDVAEDYEQELIRNLRAEFEEVVRKQFLREEQARIKEQIREEERVQAQYEKELKEIERQRKAIQKALDQALKESADEHGAEIQELREKLSEAEQRSQRTKSMAEQGVKAGHVYVLSNIGAFGEGVFKIGMSRRLKPEERVKELSSASVPFPFDVHMMISCDNAPTLENTLHKALDEFRVNRVNLRKEFFRSDIETIAQLVETHHGQVDYVATPEAMQYHETQDMDDGEFELMHRVLEEVEHEMGG